MNKINKINRKLEQTNAELVNGIIFSFGLIGVLSSLFLKDDTKTIILSIGCSLIASSVVAFMSSRYLVRRSKIKEIIDNWGLESIYRTRQEMNISCDKNLQNVENELDIIAFGLKSFRHSQHEAIVKKVQKGLKARILTINPYSIFLAQREVEENEVDGQIRKTIIDLQEWVEELKKHSKNPDNIQIKFYDGLPQDFYFRVDEHIYVGPYLYGISSQQTISYEFSSVSQGFDHYKNYFEKLWKNEEYCKDNYEEFKAQIKEEIIG